MVIDMAVTMPAVITKLFTQVSLLMIFQSLFQEKDYLNYRYFHKRAYYLACIASAIDATTDYKVHVQYQYQNDSPLQPVLLISPVSSKPDCINRYLQNDLTKSRWRRR